MGSVLLRGRQVVGQGRRRVSEAHGQPHHHQQQGQHAHGFVRGQQREVPGLQALHHGQAGQQEREQQQSHGPVQDARWQAVNISLTHDVHFSVMGHRLSRARRRYDSA